MIRRPPRSTLFPLHDALPIFRPAPRRRGEGPEVALGARPEAGGAAAEEEHPLRLAVPEDRKSTRLNSSHANISYAVFCLKKKKTKKTNHISHTKQYNSRRCRN